MRSFPARYGGRCAECRERIAVDDLIRMTDGGAVHDDCDAAAEPEPRRHPVCSVCWLEHPEGACDR